MSWMYDFAKTYVRCTLANTATTLTVASIATGIGLTFAPTQKAKEFGTCLALVSSVIFLGTGCGFHTHYVYAKTRRHLKKHGYLDSDFESKCVTYCSHVGKELALKDAGLENLIR
ncbi:MAG TPA: hypothetical protein VK158_01620 [Acidobacteriota bacterium]|nr:hypothetical protein [Acidobacteriota bacterium]